MADELIPVSEDEQDEAVFRAWESGKGLRTLARQFGLSVTQIQAALDRALPAFDAKNQLLAFKRELHRLQDLSDEFFVIAKRDKDRESAHLVARLNERIAAMRGWTSVNIRMDPYVSQVEAQPSRHEKIREAIMRLTQRSPAEQAVIDRMKQLGPEKALEILGPPQPNNDDGAVDVLAGACPPKA